MSDMEINPQTLKALASDTRLAILKALAERRKMPAELSRQLGMSSSTVVEHLSVLEKSGLVKRVETGHKWIYYELTSKGVGLIKPRFPVQFVLMLSLGIVLVFGGFARYTTSVFGGKTMAAQTMTEAAGAAAPTATPDWLLISLLVVGIVLLGVGIIGLLKGRLTWSK
jgi:DNA-binding transcriptional ArsR family regulator